MKKQQVHLGERIKRLRAFKGLTQQDLAAAIGKTRSLVSYLERTGNINPYTLQEIATALQVNVAQIENTGAVDVVMEGVTDTVLEDPKTIYTTTNERLLQQLQQEIVFLKDTVNHQWQLLHELAKSK